MAIRHTSRREDGQVYPALLAAVIGGLAIMLAFVSLQYLMDQGDRADSAADAAALAVGRGFRDNLIQRLEAADDGSNSDDLDNVLSILRTAGLPPGADGIAQRFASANGADVDGGVRFVELRTNPVSWVFELTTRQQDAVTEGNVSAHSKSTSRVAVELTGVCAWPNGIEIGSACVTLDQWHTACTEPPPPPPPPPPPSGSPTPTPTSTSTPWTEAPICNTNLVNQLSWKIRLVN